jgi:hypothetical protein
MAERLKGKLRSIVLERWKVKSVSRYLSHPGLRGYDDDALVLSLSCWQRLVSVNMYHVWINRGGAPESVMRPINPASILTNPGSALVHFPDLTDGCRRR